jgi:hypothetical protein
MAGRRLAASAALALLLVSTLAVSAKEVEQVRI